MRNRTTISALSNEDLIKELDKLWRTKHTSDTTLSLQHERWGSFIKSKGVKKLSKNIINRAYKALKASMLEDSDVQKDKVIGIREKAIEAIFYLERYRKFLRKGEFSDRKYYVYFLYLQGKAEPLLGRSLLFLEEDNRAKLDNPRKAKEAGYPSGSYKTVGDFLFIDLKGEVDVRQLHIKIQYNSAEQDLYVGSYSALDDRKIVTGSLILKETKADELERQPVLIHPRDFDKSRLVPSEEITKYLALKSLNYAKIPNNIKSFDSLKEHITSNQSISLSRQRFLEPKIPRILIAAPFSAIKDTKQREVFSSNITGLVKKLEQHPLIENRLDVVNYRDDSSGILRSIAILQLLKRTRVLLLFLTKTEAHTFALIELGWALAHVKHIIICYPRNKESQLISDSLVQLHTIDGVEFMPYQNLSDATHDKFSNEIAKSIDHRLNAGNTSL